MSIYDVEQLNLMGYLSFLLKIPNFIFGDFINEHRAFGLEQMYYVSYTLSWVVL